MAIEWNQPLIVQSKVLSGKISIPDAIGI